jgi:hypothetical protein
MGSQVLEIPTIHYDAKTTTTIQECDGTATITGGMPDTEEIEATRFQGVQTPEYVEGETYTFKSISPSPSRHIERPMAVATPEFIASPERIEDGPSTFNDSLQDVGSFSNTCSSTQVPSPALQLPLSPGVADSVGQDVTPNQKTSKKRKRNRRDVGDVSRFFDLEAEVSHDEEDDEDDEDMGMF